jgi:hypothetical protein
MNTLLIQNGGAVDALPTTSLIRRLLGNGASVHVITNRELAGVIACIPQVKVDILPAVEVGTYDLAINLHPDPLGGELMNRVHADEKRGYGFDGEHIVFLDRCADLHYRATRLGIPTDKNLFQLLYGMAGETWRGEGYDVRYYPRNRQNKSLVGLCVKDPVLRGFISRNISVTGIVKPLPLKRSVVKQMDEINRCKRLVTDDEGCMHIGVALRKRVEFITRRPPAHAIEMFGFGSVHVFDIHSEERHGS